MGMKSSSAAPLRKAVDPRTRARNAVLLNQFATPGLGSLMAGRYVAGTGQLLLALAGFGLIAAWFVLVMMRLYDQINLDSSPEIGAYGRVGLSGAALFAIAWVWSLVTSISLLRHARVSESELEGAPPKI
jgi:hypothetical protein